ncbi:MAG: hypothetical protein J7L12_00865 [Desulfurococcales archaeon]|nr:hypothetical protein [Desulfurococcales archaeon]
MRKIRVQHLILKVFSHATEDPNKVRKAVMNILPEELRDKVVFDEVVTKGHYGNEIRVLTLKLKRKEALETLKHILCNMSEVERNILLATLETRVDPPSHLYLRLSKQDAYRGSIRLLDSGDVIRLAVTIEGATTIDEMCDFLSNLVKVC